MNNLAKMANIMNQLNTLMPMIIISFVNNKAFEFISNGVPEDPAIASVTNPDNTLSIRGPKIVYAISKTINDAKAAITCPIGFAIYYTSPYYKYWERYYLYLSLLSRFNFW